MLNNKIVDKKKKMWNNTLFLWIQAEDAFVVSVYPMGNIGKMILLKTRINVTYFTVEGTSKLFCKILSNKEVNISLKRLKTKKEISIFIIIGSFPLYLRKLHRKQKKNDPLKVPPIVQINSIVQIFCYKNITFYKFIHSLYYRLCFFSH